MPTGYTSAIKDDISFEQFALQCARAFGALITMRDDPNDAEIPDSFEPSPFYQENIDKATTELIAIMDVSASEAKRLAKKQYDDQVDYIKKQMKKNNELREKYKAMLQKVRAWEPPSKDHVEMKKFMVDQIVQSIDFDCSNEYYLKSYPQPLTGEQYKASEIKRLSHDIEHYTTELKKEKDRCEERSLWVRKLKESLEVLSNDK